MKIDRMELNSGGSYKYAEEFGHDVVDYKTIVDSWNNSKKRLMGRAI